MCHGIGFWRKNVEIRRLHSLCCRLAFKRDARRYWNSRCCQDRLVLTQTTISAVIFEHCCQPG